MSRVILSKYDDGSSHVVVGWDHPAAGAFWQEWATKQEVRDAENALDEYNRSEGATLSDDDYGKLEVIVETGVKREGGMWPGIKLKDLRESMPEELRPLVTDEVLDLLSLHSEDPDSGYNKGAIDMSLRVKDAQS